MVGGQRQVFAARERWRSDHHRFGQVRRVEVNHLFKVNWQGMLAMNHPFELFLRGSLTYIGILVLLRVFKREAGSIGITDLLVLLLIADAAANAMADDYKSITDGAVLVITLIFWSYVLDLLSYHFPVARRLILPVAMPLIQDGLPLTSNLRRRWITDEELLSKIRLAGAEDLAQVKAAYFEVDGRISVIVDEARGAVLQAQPQS